MNLLQLIRSFTRTADTGSIAAAARSLGISATAVGQNIHRLEAHLGVRLLNRSTRQLALSEAGALYLAQVRHIETDLARAQALVTSGDIEPAGPLRIASSRAFGRHVLAPLLPSLQQRYPQLQLVVHEDLTQHLLERLRGYQIDAALLALPLEDHDLDQLALFDEPFWFACPPQHSLAQAEWVAEGDLQDETLLLLADGHCLRGQALAACGRQAEPEEGSDDFRAVSLETICQLVSAGLGCTLLPALAARRSLSQSLAIRPMRSRNDSRRIGLVWRRGYPRAQELALLARLVRENVPEGTRPV